MTREELQSRSWKTSDGDIAGEQVLAVLDAMPDKAAMGAVYGATSFTDRRMDRTLQLLRKAGLATYDTKRREWRRKEGT